MGKTIQTMAASLAHAAWTKTAAKIGGGTYDAAECSEAARALEAFPAMLAALQLAEGWIDAEREGEETGEGQQARWILDTIRAAIAAATGGSTGEPAAATVEGEADLTGTLRSIATMADNAKDSPRAQTGALFDIRDAALAAIGEDLAGE